MDVELLLQPVMKPGVMLVASAHPSAGARRDDTEGCEALDAFKLCLLLRILDYDGVGLRTGLPHGDICTQKGAGMGGGGGGKQLIVNSVDIISITQHPEIYTNHLYFYLNLQNNR